MKIWVITGEVAMGKSTVAKIFKRYHFPIYNADSQVHLLMQPKGVAVKEIEKIFIGVKNQDGSINRKKLGDIVFNDKEALTKLQNIIYPLLRVKEKQFLQRCYRQHKKQVILEIPLLFETKRQNYFDKVLLISAPSFLQQQRILTRPLMNLEKFKAIKQHFLPEHYKKLQADEVILTGNGLKTTTQKIKQLIVKMNNA